jgi:hypothetical protein
MNPYYFHPSGKVLVMEPESSMNTVKKDGKAVVRKVL